MTGKLLERKALRYTPAGIPVSEGWLQHSSSQIENKTERLVEVEIAVLALGDSARWLEAVPLSGGVKVTGFLAARNRNSKMPVLHVHSIEFLEGNENGSILQEEG
ncbi:primosomal replication protein N [Dechloromonas sp. TW-R-39-2]|nr:primosomal replication protein N [Dechloromonas sp. TW-R-39-2]QRM20185.1 primosomal replication protein N [Dechloromonas sp. TW-R-39-2]UCV13259.1 primosomal replication protein N [Dechloromonas denitrificans]